MNSTSQVDDVTPLCAVDNVVNDVVNCAINDVVN